MRIMASPKNIVGNSVAGGACVYCGVGGFAPGILRAFGRFQWAADIEWIMILFIHENIQWDAVFRLGFIITFFILIGFNWYFFKRIWAAAIAHFEKDWTVTARDALYYIAYNSYLCLGLSDRDRPRVGLEALNKAIKEGKVEIRGRRPGEIEWISVSPKELAEAGISFDSVKNPDEGTGGKLTALSDKNKVLYEGVLVEFKTVQKMWPERHGGKNAWMGR